MAIITDAVTERGAGGPALPARPLTVFPARRTGRRIRVDRWASRLVVVGGIVIIAAILAILFVIVAEVYPLFRKPTVTLASLPFAGPGSAWRLAGSEGLGVDEYRAIAYGIDQRGTLRMLSLKDGRALPPVPIPGLDGAQVSAVGYGGHSPLRHRHVGRACDSARDEFEAAFPGGSAP